MKKQYRVKKSKEIEEILKKHCYFSTPYFTIYINIKNETNHFRYAMSVGKKIGNAVERNCIKRKVRAIIRNFNIINGVDIFIIVREKVLNLSFQEMTKELKYLFNKRNLLVKGENNASIY